MRYESTPAGVLVAVAALASAAAGQGVMQFGWTISDTGNGDGVLEPGESLVTTLYASMNPGQIGFADARFWIDGNEEWQRGTIEVYDNLLDSLTDDGDLQSDNTITGIEAFQLPQQFNPDFIADNPIAIYRIVWTPENGVYRHVEWGILRHGRTQVFTDTFGSTVSYDAVPGRASISIPAPGAIALVGIAGLGAVRRQR